MKIAGLQKLTLLDFPGTVACTVFTYGCNFRCPFCHNGSLVRESQMCETSISDEEIFDFLNKRKGIIDGVAITGGEPTINKDLPEFLSRIKALGFKIKLDTNGTFPDMLKHVVKEGLVDYVAMDIKGPPQLYSKFCGINEPDIDAVYESRSFLMECGISYEFRTTVVKGLHKGEDLINTAKWIEGAKAYYLQHFENSGDLLEDFGLTDFSEEEMFMFAEDIKPIIPAVNVRGF